ncbi:MAG TPA: FkbM family methyltransferase [Ideonella sp.]|nr:FkbM family methyltransferase [Ideonella sp.]
MNTTSTTTTSPYGVWPIEVDSGLTVFAPDRLSSLTTHVLLEQERWFESEIAIVAKLLEPGMCALDIGANHGVYSLALAQHLSGGHVWSFEPTQEPRSRLTRSMERNGLAGRMTIVPMGLSNTRREATFAISANSELNSGNTAGAGATTQETVLLETLDAYAAQIDRPIDFVKLDAEGEEANVLIGGHNFFTSQSPVVMFELRHGSQLNLPLIAQFEALGYGLFRHHPELDLLVAFHVDSAEHASVLNLFAIKPDRQATLPRLVRQQDFVAPGPLAAAAADGALAALQGKLHAAWPAPTEAQAERHGAIGAIASAHFGAASGGQRVAQLLAARGQLQALIASGRDTSPEAWVAMVHTVYALGQQMAAVNLAMHVLAHWPAGHQPSGAFMPPLLSDLERPQSTDLGAWLKLCLLEFVETRRAYSSYFLPSDAASLQPMLAHPDHSAQIERRAVLNELRRGKAPDAALLSRLARGRNGALWAALAATVPPAAATAPAPLAEPALA